MGKKMKLIPFLFKPTEPPSSWLWPSCGTTKSPSFRAERIMNSLYVTDSRFNNSAESAGRLISTTELAEEEYGGAESIENVIRGLKSERLFFEAGETSSSIKKNTTNSNVDGPTDNPRFEQSNTLVMEVDSRDPFVDFKRSMEEMVEVHGLNLKDWDVLQELLSCYLKVNGKSNHGYIVGAFVDLLVALEFASSIFSCSDNNDQDSSSTTAITRSPISALSFNSSSSSISNSTNPCLSSLEEEEIQEVKKHL